MSRVFFDGAVFCWRNTGLRPVVEADITVAHCLTHRWQYSVDNAVPVAATSYLAAMCPFGWWLEDRVVIPKLPELVAADHQEEE